MNEETGKLTGEEPTPRTFAIVGIGASAGGLEALETFFDAMPATDKFAFVVVQHLSPDYKSLMAELLTKHTRMAVHEGGEGMEVEAGNIYLIPRKTNMSIFNGRLFLTPQEQGLNLPIDLFFTSLAEDQGETSVGIVLSGTGSDGTRGIRAIKEAGGIVMVQDEDSAKFNGMPRSATATGIVDYVLPPDRLARELVNIASGNFSLLRGLDNARVTAGNSLAKIFLLIKRKTGIDLSFYKDSTILRRLERRMAINQISDVERYISFLEEFPSEISSLFKEILIGVTRFFRDPEAFEVLAERVIPAVINSRAGAEPIRIWVPACSTGEEAYSLAILVSEYLDQNYLQADVKVFATDIDKDAIEFASHGLYPESIAADASRERLAKYFVRKGDSYQIAPRIREMVIFAYHNVFKDPPFRRIDLVSCRNLLIYLQPVLQKKVLSNFHFSLSGQGYVFLGSSETLGDFSKYFRNIDTKWKIFQYTGETTAAPGDAERPELRLHERLSLVERNRRGIIAAPSKPANTVFERLIESYFPPTAIVDDQRDVQHIFGDVSDYLTLPLGRMDLDILKMAKAAVSIPLGSALQSAVKELRETTYEGITVVDGEDPLVVDLTVKPIRGPLDQRYFAVLFERKTDAKRSSARRVVYDVDDTMRSRISELENELKYTKENLQATIEELETSNEELQATNEELLSSNEELQSTNEELQSVNEELITVNSEYQKKIEELSLLTSDVENLLAATDIGTIFLDNDMTIRKFTPAAVEWVKIIKSDVGRPISDLTHNLDYDDFQKDLQEVLRRRVPKEAEIQDVEGRWVLMRLNPYQGEEGWIGGLVISLIDITQRKQAELALLRQHDLLMRILEASPAATTMVDQKGRLVFVNRRAQEVLGISRDDLSHLRYNSASFSITDCHGNPIDDAELPFSRLMASRTEVVEARHCIRRPDGALVGLSISGSPIYTESGAVEGAVFTLEVVDPFERVADQACADTAD